MKHRVHAFQIVLTALLAISASLFTACGSDDADVGGGTPVTTTVNITLDEFSVIATPNSAPAGKVKFHVTNVGEDVHELVVLKTNLPPGMIPLNAEGDADEDAAGVANIGEKEDIASGASADLELDLGAGKYVLICNLAMVEPDGSIEHHYAEGMYSGFTVQ